MSDNLKKSFHNILFFKGLVFFFINRIMVDLCITKIYKYLEIPIVFLDKFHFCLFFVIAKE